MSIKKRFVPRWVEEPPTPKSYRSIFKWGDPNRFKHPNKRLYKAIKESLGMTDEDFQGPAETGNRPVEIPDRPVGLSDTQVKIFQDLVGAENVAMDDYSRVAYSAGKTIEEALELRSGTIPHLCDLAIHPRHKGHVEAVVAACHQERIPLYVYGGGSSVNFGFRPERGGVTLVMGTYMNRVLEVNETDQTCRVQAGILGPALEAALNGAKDRYGTRHRYTCGHFPQSFEYSSVGGWVTTLGSGQASTYYGDAYDLMFSAEVVTPLGTVQTEPFPACANGPRMNDIVKGSEGVFGVVVEVTLKIFRYQPKNRLPFGYIFRSWDDAVNASREISQGEFGLPAVLRISDVEETDIGLKLYGVEGTVLDTLMGVRGYRKGGRTLLLGHTEGEEGFSKNVLANVRAVCKSHGGMYLTGYPTRKWEHSRYTDPYLREDLADYGVIIDTLETSVRWSNLHQVHQGVRAVVKGRPNTICMTHASHFYPQGTNLYFIYVMKSAGVDDYRAFQKEIIEAIVSSGGSLSHHHGVGRMLAPWMERFHGSVGMGVYRSLKEYFDPHGVLNPGSTMGL